MSNPFGAILATTGNAATPLKKSSPPVVKARVSTGPFAKPVVAKPLGTTTPAAKPPAPKTKRNSPPYASSSSAASSSSIKPHAKTSKANNKVVEIRSILKRLETLTGGRLESAGLFKKFVNANRDAAAASARDMPGNLCPNNENFDPKSGNVRKSCAGRPSQSRPFVETAQVSTNEADEGDEEDDLDDFDYTGLGLLSPERKGVQKHARYSLGVNRFSLPGRMSIDTRRMSLSEIEGNCRGGLSPLKSGALFAAGKCADVPGPRDGFDGNFLEFCAVGVDRAVLSGFEPPQRTHLQPSQLLDLFPARDPACPSPIIETISDYCFPYGTVMRLVSGQEEIDRIEQAPIRDAFHVMQFMDATGNPTFASCLTVTELIDPPNEVVVENLTELKSMEHACDTIKRFLRRILEGSLTKPLLSKSSATARPQQTPQKGTAASVGSALMSRISAWSARKTPSRFTGNAAETPRTSIFSQVQGKPDADSLDTHSHGASVTPERLMYNPNGLAEFFSDENSICSDSESIDGDSDGGKVGSREDILLRPPMQRRRTSSTVSSNTVAPNAVRTPHMILTQRAYCIVSTKPLHTFFFKVLEAVAHKERSLRTGMRGAESRNLALSPSMLKASALLSMQVRDFSRNRSASSTSNISSSSTSCARGRSESTTSIVSTSSSASISLHSASGGGILCDAYFFARKARRDRFLSQMQRLQLGEGDTDGVVHVSCPSYVKKFRIENRATTLQQWTAATLFSTLPANVIVQLLSMLLLEKSLIISGSDVGLVTAIGTALTHLLSPFQWEGVFVPILPFSALEVLEAPVPFIVGTTANLPPLHEVSSAAAVLFLDDYLENDVDSVGRINTNRRKTHRRRFLLVPSDDSNASLCDVARSSDLLALAAEIEPLAKQLRPNKRAPSLRIASVQLVSFMLGMTTQEKQLVDALLALVSRHNRRLCGEGMLETGGWRKYGLINQSSKQFEFYPEMFIDPLRARLAFQEGVVHTQLFVSLMDRLKAGDDAALLD